MFFLGELLSKSEILERTTPGRTDQKRWDGSADLEPSHLGTPVKKVEPLS